MLVVKPVQVAAIPEPGRHRGAVFGQPGRNGGVRPSGMVEICLNQNYGKTGCGGNQRDAGNGRAQCSRKSESQWGNRAGYQSRLVQHFDGVDGAGGKLDGGVPYTGPVHPDGCGTGVITQVQISARADTKSVHGPQLNGQIIGGVVIVKKEFSPTRAPQANLLLAIRTKRGKLMEARNCFDVGGVWV